MVMSFPACRQDSMVAFPGPQTLALVSVSSFVVKLVSRVTSWVMWMCCCGHFSSVSFIAQEQKPEEVLYPESMPYADKKVRSNGAVSGMSSWLWHLYVGKGLPLSFYCGKKSMHSNELECFFFFNCICTQSILQNLTLYLNTVEKVYIFRFIHLPHDKASTQWSHLGVLLCLWQVWYSVKSTGRVDNCRKKNIHRVLIYFPLFKSNVCRKKHIWL